MIDLLQHNKINKAGEHIWMGIYDWKKFSSYVVLLKSTSAGAAFRTFNLSYDDFLTLLQPGKWGNYFIYN